MDFQRHQHEIGRNRKIWQSKPILRSVYRTFHAQMAKYLVDLPGGLTVELGSGIGNIEAVVPDCIKTDMFANPWIDQVENAYHLSFPNASVSNLLLLDVFHHLKYPGSALEEFYRVSMTGGRLIILEPSLSLLGLAVYGALHAEPLGLLQPIRWHSTSPDELSRQTYYAAQGNACRIFTRSRFLKRLNGWKLVERKSSAAIAYVLSGGYSGPQLIPEIAMPHIVRLEKLLDKWPSLFATRFIAVLEKCPSCR